ncbi:unnamed protein product [Pedinophyceae sp. YPF-701]|nr:unnamed protein product [Pedinophyceae sp. YPF-701]
MPTVNVGAKPVDGPKVEPGTTIAAKVHGGLKHLVYAPESFGTGDPLPLLVFLHGAGESGSDPWDVRIQGVAKLAIPETDPGPTARLPSAPTELVRRSFVVLSPQNPGSSSWTSDATQQALTATVKAYAALPGVDERRVYLTGISMGGFGTFFQVSRAPELYAAAVPVCGGGRAGMGAAIATAGVPLWAWHGANDAVVPVSGSDAMIAEAKKASADPESLVRYTRVPQSPARDPTWPTVGIPDMPGHASWVDAYESDSHGGGAALFTWMLAQAKPAE